MPPKKSNPKKPVPVASVKHKDKRANIPTRELADFVVKEEQAPFTMLYPRDPSLDPQLVWKGKDEQDRHDLAVPTVPIYIQEKISPQALIENLRLEQKRGKSEPQANLFADFNGIEFEKLIEFYQHEQNWSNRMILGDSLLVINGESFFARHAYFCGADEPYDRLKRALRAEIDESAWQSLYSTKSRPFAPPASGKIAIKVINHYGDEVLKVYQTSL